MSTKVIHARIKVQFDYEDIIPVTAVVSISDEHAEVTEIEADRLDGGELHYQTLQAIEEKCCELAWEKLA